jgi:hypothetical protein
MSFDLAIWAGDPPSSDAEACRTLDDLLARYDTDADEAEPPDPRVLACKREITSSYSDGWLGALFGSVWASAPLEVHGRLLYMNLTWSTRTDVILFIARTAAKHGLVCFDPQASSVVDVTRLEALRIARPVSRRLRPHRSLPARALGARRGGLAWGHAAIRCPCFCHIPGGPVLWRRRTRP